MTDWELLRRYVKEGSQDAFSTLTARYVNLVYSICVRDLGDRTLAEDVTQVVFLLMAKKAPSFRPGIVLTGWLFQTARLTCRDALRQERRRAARERKAVEMADQMRISEQTDAALWEQIEPHINNALAALRPQDRDVILLRLVEGHSLTETGIMLGISEEAARKRASRAVEKMRRHLDKAGIAVSAAALTVLLPTHSVHTAPPMLSASLLHLTLETVAGTHISLIYQGTINTMRMMTIKTSAAVGVALLLTTIAGIGVAKTYSASVTPSVDPQAEKLLQQMAAAYQSLDMFSCTETAEGEDSLGMPYQMEFTYRRPDQMAVTVTRPQQGKDATKRYLMNGKALYIINPAKPDRYIVINTPRKNYTLWQDALIAHADVKMPVTMELLEDSKGLMKGIASHGSNVTYMAEKSEILDGVLVDHVRIQNRDENGNSSEEQMLIGHEDHLLRQIKSRSELPNHESVITTQTFTNVQANPQLASNTFVFTPPAAAVAVEEKPGGSQADPKAVALLTRMYVAYDQLKSFSCAVDTNFGKQATYAIQKPYLVSCTRTSLNNTAHPVSTQAISDGNNLYVTTTEGNALPGVYLKIPLKQNDWNTRLYLSRFGNIPQYGQSWDFVPNAILGAVTMPADSYNWQMGLPEVINGEAVDTVTVREDNGQDNLYILLTLWISRADHLLRRVSMDTRQGDEAPQRQMETYTRIKTNPAFPASMFVFTPPPGSQAVSIASDLYDK